MQKAKRKIFTHSDVAKDFLHREVEQKVIDRIKRDSTIRTILDCGIAIGMAIVLGLLVYIFVAIPLCTGVLS